ncbi:MAG: hypothetical protein LBS60_03155 [Deltaproteobacteria bacterium]|jgi:hypothetical protein|nr:hypothetical protein [Deltaproteobacteria bacterium]
MSSKIISKPKIDEPIDKNQVDNKYSCPFLGTAKGGTLTVDKFIEMKQAEIELEDQNDKRLFPWLFP